MKILVELGIKSSINAFLRPGRGGGFREIHQERTHFHPWLKLVSILQIGPTALGNKARITPTFNTETSEQFYTFNFIRPLEERPQGFSIHSNVESRIWTCIVATKNQSKADSFEDKVSRPKTRTLLIERDGRWSEAFAARCLVEIHRETTSP